MARVLSAEAKLVVRDLLSATLSRGVVRVAIARSIPCGGAGRRKADAR
jgi:hypothetical protein